MTKYSFFNIKTSFNDKTIIFTYIIKFKILYKKYIIISLFCFNIFIYKKYKYFFTGFLIQLCFLFLV